MLRFFTAMFFIVFFIPETQSQKTPYSNDLIEGGKLAVEIIKLFKKSKTPDNHFKDDCMDSLTADLKIINAINDPLKIVLTNKTQPHINLTELVVPGKEEAFIFSLKVGIYILEIYDFNSLGIMKKSEIKLEICKETTIKVKA